MKSLLLLSLFITLTTPVLARIGETPEQCEARYGAPYISKEEATYHNKAGFHVVCTYAQGKCAQITFTHTQDDNRRSTPLSEAEITTLLKANSGGKTWKEAGEDSWETEDLEAIYSPSGRSAMLYIAIKKTEGENKLKDF